MKCAKCGTIVNTKKTNINHVIYIEYQCPYCGFKEQLKTNERQGHHPGAKKVKKDE